MKLYDAASGGAENRSSPVRNETRQDTKTKGRSECTKPTILLEKIII